MDNANLRRATCMPIGQSFDLDATGEVVTSRTVEQAERLCTQLRSEAGSPGRIRITRKGDIITVKAVE